MTSDLKAVGSGVWQSEVDRCQMVVAAEGDLGLMAPPYAQIQSHSIVLSVDLVVLVLIYRLCRPYQR